MYNGDGFGQLSLKNTDEKARHQSVNHIVTVLDIVLKLEEGGKAIRLIDFS